MSITFNKSLPGRSLRDVAQVAVISILSFMAAVALLAALFAGGANQQVLTPEPTSPPALIERALEEPAPSVVTTSDTPAGGGRPAPLTME